MNRQFALVLITVAAVFAATTAIAQQHRPYDQIMKDVGVTWASLKKNLDSNSGAAAAEDAAKLQGLFAEVQGFWHPSTRTTPSISPSGRKKALPPLAPQPKVTT
ncbi:MAG: hypothetical protein DMG15_19395 [Acidobacteria bacterium]|nr:MAG: hypothetical protein DMG15_19395 [Acidobacteriota bacterium]